MAYLILIMMTNFLFGFCLIIIFLIYKSSKWVFIIFDCNLKKGKQENNL